LLVLAAFAALLIISLLSLAGIGRIIERLEVACPSAGPPRSVSCEAIPLQFVHDDPACADKLLHAMNITNVHIGTWSEAHQYVQCASREINRS